MEDTNDINNFDKAIAALRAKRSFYIPFRGNDGAVSEAQEHISQLQTELSEADGLYAALEQIQNEAAQCTTAQEQKQGALESVRTDILQASQVTAKEMLTKQYENLKNRQACNIDEMEKIKHIYAAGIPTRAELDELRPLYDQVLALDSQIIQTDAERDTEVIIAENAQRFSTGGPTDQDLREQQEKCRYLISAESKLKNTDPFCGGEMSVHETGKIFLGRFPFGEVLQQNQETLRRINVLREENVCLAAAQVQSVQAEVARKRKRVPIAPLAFILGAAILIVGIVMLSRLIYEIGEICLGVGMWRW